MTHKTPNKRPSHSVFLVEGEGETAFWTKIGSAWPHEDGEGFNISLSAIPLNGRIVIRKRQEREKEGAGR